MSQVTVFQCPQCREYIASDAKNCRFCKTPMNPAMQQAAAEATAAENKQYRKSRYSRHMLSGAGLFALGAVITIGSYTIASMSEGGGHYVISYGLVLVGAGNFLYGLIGWLGELRQA